MPVTLLIFVILGEWNPVDLYTPEGPEGLEDAWFVYVENHVEVAVINNGYHELSSFVMRMYKSARLPYNWCVPNEGKDVKFCHSFHII